MIIEGLVLSLKETTYNKRNTIEIQISKETFDNLMAVSHLGDEYEICGKPVVIYDEEADKRKNETGFSAELFDTEQYCKILQMKVDRLEKALKDLGYMPIYLDR